MTTALLSAADIVDEDHFVLFENKKSFPYHQNDKVAIDFAHRNHVYEKDVVCGPCAQPVGYWPAGPAARSSLQIALFCIECAAASSEVHDAGQEAGARDGDASASINA